MEERRAGGQGGLRGHLHSAVIFPAIQKPGYYDMSSDFARETHCLHFQVVSQWSHAASELIFKTVALSCTCWHPHGPPLPWKSEYHRRGPLNRTLRTSGHSSLSQVSSVVGFKNYISAQTPPQVEPLWEYKLDMCLICLNYFYFD